VSLYKPLNLCLYLIGTPQPKKQQESLQLEVLDPKIQGKGQIVVGHRDEKKIK
jgi:hypothetical protein